MQSAIDTVDAIREMTGAWVIAIHPSGHSDKSRARGSIVLRGAPDTEYRMGPLHTGRDTLLDTTKIKNGANPPLMSLRCAAGELRVEDEYGHEVTSHITIHTKYNRAERPPAPP